jgi:hypothetical protein
VRLIVVLAIAACSRPALTPMPPVPVAIVAWPSPVRPDCYLPEITPPPKLTPFEKIDPLDAPRTYVRAADVHDFVAWAENLYQAHDLHRKCLQKLTGNP